MIQNAFFHCIKRRVVASISLNYFLYVAPFKINLAASNKPSPIGHDTQPKNVYFKVIHFINEKGGMILLKKEIIYFT
jgi:hypothetical protein